MEFEFLPQLPKSDLDDRRFEDLVDECLLRIPRYCPEWTNYNASDPGITLIELFAWLTDQMLLRFNQVPRRNYVAFLELLGIRLRPPSPAETAVTFYLTRAQGAREPGLGDANRLPPILAGTEVATERTETEEAVVFSTVRNLHLGVPRLRHFLTAAAPHTRLDERAELDRLGAIADPSEQERQREMVQLQDCLSQRWREEGGRWSGREQYVFRRTPEPGNCFYLVFDADEPLDGNVIQVTIEGEPAGSTGIDPRHPPRRWEAWERTLEGDRWAVGILIQEQDDGTAGFSFDEATQEPESGVRLAQVRLHLPLEWPVVEFQGYRGRWLRCVYTPPADQQLGYSRSPQFTALSARTVGGTTRVIQAMRVENELLGESDGKPGQIFELKTGNILPHAGAVEFRPAGEARFQDFAAQDFAAQGFAVQGFAAQDFAVQGFAAQGPRSLENRPQEGLTVTLAGMVVPQTWQEVEDFSNSGPEDLHYTLDAIAGRIQFGPLIRESGQLQEAVGLRRQVQAQGVLPTAEVLHRLEQQERQYGKVPPRGAQIRMASYRSGGGARGNVRARTITILKSAIPYVSQVINYGAARNGADAESLEEAVLRVPRMLRTVERAVTPEDYETLAMQASRGVARAYCPRGLPVSRPGTTQVFVVPQVSPVGTGLGVGLGVGLGASLGSSLEASWGVSPQQLSLAGEANRQLRQTVQAYLDERKLLGTEVELCSPRFTGVIVEVELSVQEAYGSPEARDRLRQRLMGELFEFLNPIRGGKDGRGWSLGQILYRADVIALVQRSPEVRYLQTLELFQLTPSGLDGSGSRGSGSSEGATGAPWVRSLARDGLIDPGPTGLICSWRDAQQTWGHSIRFMEDLRP